MDHNFKEKCWRASNCELHSAHRHQRLDVSEALFSMGWKAGYCLRDAAVSGDLATVKSLLDAGADPNSVSIQAHGFFRPWVHGRPALWHAAAQGNLDMLNLLLFRGANPNQVSWISSTALWTACSLGHVAIVNRLLAAGADPDLVGVRNTKPLAVWLCLHALPMWSQGRAVNCEIGSLLQRAGADLSEIDDLIATARLQMQEVGYPQERLEDVPELHALRAHQQCMNLNGAVDAVDRQSESRRL